MSDVHDDPTYLTGQLLIAMPQMDDPRFARSVIYLCAHSEDGAMGLVLNKPLDQLTLGELLNHLGIAPKNDLSKGRVHFGGPVDSARGFVLHSADYTDDGTTVIADGIALTATVTILHAIGEGLGPRNSLLALGYAGWGPGQLDAEIQANGWLHAPVDQEIVFDPNQETKWQRAIQKIGIDFAMLSADAGHA
jgi:putative transcriptional regulator